jgi:hypothetical protein
LWFELKTNGTNILLFKLDRVAHGPNISRDLSSHGFEGSALNGRYCYSSYQVHARFGSVWYRVDRDLPRVIGQIIFRRKLFPAIPLCMPVVGLGRLRSTLDPIFGSVQGSSVKHMTSSCLSQPLGYSAGYYPMFISFLPRPIYGYLPVSLPFKYIVRRVRFCTFPQNKIDLVTTSVFRLILSSLSVSAFLF